jgi:choline dehydrogenase-like flavoprotein
MLRDARQLPGNWLIDTDLCIIGAGPAGITIAAEFLGQGTRVCLVESGGLDLERRAQRLNHGTSVGYSTYLLHHARVRAFGGSSRHWVGPGDETWAARPLDPVDFEVRPGVPYSGWPFDPAQLEPQYEQARSICRLGPEGPSPATWDGETTASALPLRGAEVETTVFQHGTSTFEGYHHELARSANVTLLLHATAVDLGTGQDPGVVDAVELRRDDGSRCVVRPRVVVLAAGGIENPRLLLLSGRTHRRGLGNHHDLVGRFFAERLSARSGYLAGGAELLRRASFYGVHADHGTRVQGALRVADRVQRERDLLNCAFFLLPRRSTMTAEAVRSLATLVKGAGRRPLPDAPMAHLRNVVRGAGDLAALGLDKLRRPSDDRTVLVLRFQAEQAPNRESRVTLGSRRDPLGLPVAQLDWRMAASDRDSIRRSQELVDGALRAAGLGRVEMLLGDERPPALIEGNYHHLGATRMHASPRLGVTDPDCRVHGVRNLYVAGSSLFPTYGCSNPTLTVVALALRLADHLKKVLAGGRPLARLGQ